ncbi:hypothetical protein [Bacillus infantis]|uniref:hypothetical protein n=1 Tax=Bacillus infantis TaxID=324767 RepID=UPI003CF93002
MNKHKAIFKGRVFRRLYAFDIGKPFTEYGFNPKLAPKPKFYSYNYPLDDKEFLVKEIESPPIEKGEAVYISEIDKQVIVHSKVRNLDGGYIYTTNHIVEFINDEISFKSKENAKRQEEEYLSKLKLVENEKINSKSSWKFWKKLK